MPEEQNEQREEQETRPPEENNVIPSGTRSRRRFTRRHALLSSTAIALILIFGILLTVVFYRYGVFDTYVRTQFVAKMADIGIVFDADVFRVTVNPLEVELKNATFSEELAACRS